MIAPLGHCCVCRVKSYSLAFLYVAMGSLQAQDLNTMSSKANEAWQMKDYQQCQSIFDRIIKVYGDRAPQLFGSKFRVIYYRKGLAELKLAGEARRVRDIKSAQKWYVEAVDSFKTCHDKFPNRAQGLPQAGNVVHMSSLQRWAEACMGTGDYQKTLELYQKFKKERQQTDEYLPSEGDVQLNMAISYFMLKPPKIEEGVKVFQTALDNKEAMKTSNAGIQKTFLTLNCAARGQKKNEAVLDFLKKYQVHFNKNE